MRRLQFLAILITAMGLVKAQSSFPPAWIKAENDRSIKLLRARSANTGFYGYNINYHRCEWRVNPNKKKYLRGKVFSVFTITSNCDSIVFDLKSNITVDSIIWHKQKIPFSRNGDKLKVGKPGKWLSGITDSITVYYQGIPDYGSGFGYFNLDYHATGPIVYTLSEPYGAAFWWPCKQTLQDKIDSLDIIMYIPPGMKAGCNGVLISNDSLNDSTRVMHWKHRYPVATYLISFAVSNYREFTELVHWFDRPKTMPVVNYVFPQSFNDAKQNMPPLLRVLRLYDSLVGHYPFDNEKYGHAQFTWGGGMEHQTMSSVVDFGYDLLAHELAHQWFGDAVTCGSWQDLWLNEGFATYMNALCYRYLDVHKNWLIKMQGIKQGALAQTDGSVFCPDTSSINVLFSGNLRYNKGAFVLHMLREKVGDKAYFSALRKYISQPKTAYGFARTIDLQTLMESESGKKLDTFFLRWFWGQGYPILQINWEQKNGEIKLNIKQTSSHSSVPFFEIPVPIRFKTANKDSLLIFYPKTNETEYRVKLKFSVDTAEFDPEVVVLAKAALGGINLDKLKSGNYLIAPNPVGADLVIYSTVSKIDKIEIFDVSGKKVFENNSQVSVPTSHFFTVPLPDFAAGTYVTKIYSGKSVNLLKFIKR
jgi:aminopeptidase N